VGVERADSVEDVAAVRGVRSDRVRGVGGEGEALPVAEHAGGLTLGRGGRGRVLEVAADAADRGVLERADELGEPLGLDQAVRIDEREDLAAALGDAAIAGVGDAALGLSQIRHGPGLNQGGGAIAGPVVDHQDLPAVGWVVRGEDGVQAVGNR
jgi:hypothetical protein